MSITGSRSGTTVQGHLQGVPLTDDRWSSASQPGAWELMTGSELLPRYPGARVTRFEVPGGQGERRVQNMPAAARTVPLRIRFLPICTDPESPMYQRRGRDPQERAGFLANNIREFMFRTRLGAQLSMGNLRLSRTLSASEHMLDPTVDAELSPAVTPSGGTESCVGYFESDWSQDDHPTYQYSTLTALFRNPTGTWYTDWQYFGYGGLSADTDWTLEVPMGTAPVDDAMVAIQPQNSGSAPGALVRNDSGLGFQVGTTMPQDTWHFFDTYSWRMGTVPAGGFDWGIEKPDQAAMLEHGRPLGTALLITPGIAGTGDMIGRVHVRLPSYATVHIAIRPKWF